jgi:hypothetical protein
MHQITADFQTYIFFNETSELTEYLNSPVGKQAKREVLAKF